MMRRLFWLVLGAALGIAGYRRASRAARMLLPSSGLAGQVGTRPAPAALEHGASSGPTRSERGRSAASGTAAFVRDVRFGMAEYLDRHRDI